MIATPAARAAIGAFLAALVGTSGCQSSKRSPTLAVESRAWAAWPMPNPPLAGLPNPQTYDVTRAAVVSDRVTGLMWQREAPNEFFSFEIAQEHCAALTLAGFDDWRMPARIELVSILDTARIQPSIDSAAFPDTASDAFWSASAAADDPRAAWYVYFYFGYPKTDDRGSEFSARCVRSETPHALPATRYDVRSDVVREPATGLTWQRAVPVAAMSFDTASTYCSTLTLEGKTGFRLPTLNELLTLVDEHRVAPMIDKAAFADTPAEFFWTSSLFGNAPGMAWYVSFANGTALYDLTTQPYRVRCVL